MKWILILMAVMLAGCCHTKEVSNNTDTTVTHREVLPPVIDESVTGGWNNAPLGFLGQIADLIESVKPKDTTRDITYTAKIPQGTVVYTPRTNKVEIKVQPKPVVVTETNVKQTIVTQKIESFWDKCWNWVQQSFWLVILIAAGSVIVPLIIAFIKKRAV